MIFASPVAYFFNNRLLAAARGDLRRHAGRHVGAQFGRFRAVWRIGADGRLAAVSPLIDADAAAEWRDGKIYARGDAALLRLFSAAWEKADLPAMAADSLGPDLGPRALYGMERLRDAVADALARNVAAPAEVAAYGEGARRLRDGAARLARRVGAARRRMAAAGAL